LMVKTSGMIAGCEHTDACEMPIASLGSVQLRPWGASSATRKPVLSGSSGGEKNGVWSLRPHPPHLV